MHNCIAATVCHLATPQSVAASNQRLQLPLQLQQQTVAHTEQQEQQQQQLESCRVTCNTNDIYHVNL